MQNTANNTLRALLAVPLLLLREWACMSKYDSISLRITYSVWLWKYYVHTLRISEDNTNY